jgi:hypothetical protein
MTEIRAISKEQIHAQAVAIGRSRGFPGEAGRLAASDVGSTVEAMLDRLRPEAWDLSDAQIIGSLAQRLWLDWVTVEYRAAACAGVTTTHRVAGAA